VQFGDRRKFLPTAVEGATTRICNFAIDNCIEYFYIQPLKRRFHAKGKT